MELVTRVIHLIGPQIHGTRAGEAPRLGTVDARSRLVPMDQGDTSQQAATADRVLFQPGVPSGSNLATVRKAWKRLLQKYHPDLHSRDSEKRMTADELAKRLKGAYEQPRKRLERATNRQEK